MQKSYKGRDVKGLKRGVLFMLITSFLVLNIAAVVSTQDNSSVETKSYYVRQLDSLSTWSLHMKGLLDTASRKTITTNFLEGRSLYKRVEFIIEYYFPASANRLNGAPLLEAEPSQNLEPKQPQGLQVLEELVYEPTTSESRELMRYEMDNIIRSINKLKTLTTNLEPTESEILDALRLNIYTMIIKGVSGFDAPIALSGIKEANVVLENFRKIISCFSNSQEVVYFTDNAINYITANDSSFNEFNRAEFIKDYVNPICEALHDYQLKERIPFIKAQRAIRTDARTLFDQNAFNVYFFAPAGTPVIDTAQIQLGKTLFHDTRLSATGKRSCATCHQSGKAFTDGLQVNETLVGGQKLLRNTPTLLHAAWQPSQFYDSRINFLEDQIHDVVTNRAEMGGDLSGIAKRLSKEKVYSKLSKSAYGQPLTADIIRKSLAAYIRSLAVMNSPFDRYMRGDENAMNSLSIRGFNLFMGKAKCGTCHFIPLFNGAASPLYQKIESEVLGVPSKNDTMHALIDSDSGKFHLHKIPHQLHSFKTVSLRNAEHTAPYMHNGVFSTLDEVIDFYNRGGGAGIGIHLDNQTLSDERLHLTTSEKADLIEFIKTLSDERGS